MLTPAIAGLLAFTLIGVPAAIVLMAAFIVLAALGFVTASYATGLWLRQHIKPQPVAPGTTGRVAWTLLGLVVVLIMGVVPFIGWIVAALPFMAGVGAAASALVEQFKTVSVSRRNAP